MKVVTAIDSLKGSLTSLEAGNAIRDGILKVDRDAIVCVRPMADGGEGTVEALTLGMGGQLQTIRVTGPLGSPVNAQYGILEDGRTAVMEMSAAAGITLIDAKDRNPMNTTTFGVGEMILDAISKGCRHFIIGIGGSATNDGGAGMLQGLGFGLLDQNGNQIPWGARGLKSLASIDVSTASSKLQNCRFTVACDVNNPLCGPNGCSAVFGPQKGADASMIIEMDNWLCHYAELTERTFPDADAAYPGTGAAGGLGFAFIAFLNGTLEPGIDIILRETKLEEYVRDADIVITGEGRLDSQTVMGKAPSGVARIAKKYGKPVIAFSGAVTEEAVICNEHGIDAFFPIVRGICTLEEALAKENAAANMSAVVEQVFRLIKTFSK